MVSAIVYLFAFLKRLPIIQIIQDALLGAKRSKLAVCVRDDCLLEVTPNIVVLWIIIWRGVILTIWTVLETDEQLGLGDLIGSRSSETVTSAREVLWNSVDHNNLQISCFKIFVIFIHDFLLFGSDLGRWIEIYWLSVDFDLSYADTWF